MDTNDSNIKSQQTGGLRLMTVFIAVLALHVVVIGGFTAYHLMSGGGTDADITTTDKTHKDIKAADGTMIVDSTPAAPSLGDKTAPAVASTADTAPSPANTTATAQDQVTTTEVTTPAPVPSTAAVVLAPTPTPAPAVASTPASALAPAPTLTLNAPKVGLLTPPSDVTSPTAQTPSGPIPPDLAPPTEPTLAPLAAGPVHMPSVVTTPATPKVEHNHLQTYTVKITDSYKKIAKAHHISVAQLKEANHIKGDTLHTGQKLVIPSNGSIVATTTSATGTETTPTRTVLKESTSSMDSLSATPPSVTSTELHHHMYTVAKGDTLAKIAHKFKTTALAIMEVNDIADPTKLTVGKKLKIPSKESRSAKNVPVAPVAPTPVAQPSEVQVKERPVEATGELANFSL